MASTTDIVSLNTSVEMGAWVEAHSLNQASDVLNQFLSAEQEAAYDLGYSYWEDWSNDRRVFEIAISRF